MPKDIIYGTGWEHGSLLAGGEVSDTARVFLTSSEKNTGNYGIVVTEELANYWQIDLQEFLGDECYVSVYVYLEDTEAHDQYVRLEVVLTDGNSVGVRYRSTPNTWDLFRGDTLIATGTVAVSNIWNHYEFRVKIDDTNGMFQLKTIGQDDINFRGDTQPGSVKQIQQIRLEGGATFDSTFFDDLCVARGDWISDIRFEKVVPNEDIFTQFIPSTGVDNYATIDEVPASQTDYNEGLDGDLDRYGFSALDLTNKNPILVGLWGSALKNTTHDDQIEYQSFDGQIDGETFPLDVGGTLTRRMLTKNPSGKSWDQEKINNLILGIKASFEE